uniref:Uncharacterized protein n=1 Tax=Fagus sylvatica TaxID=28930 RepID=A0A2N9GFR2_FAGSY
MSRTGVLQREFRGLKPRDSTQHYAPERVTAFQTEATSVGAVCGKRASLPFTAPIQKDCMVRTRSMEIHAQALPSSSQSLEVAAMEKQVRDLTANLQELTRQNQEQQQEQRQEQEGETKGENTRITMEDSSAKWEQEIKAMRAQMGEMKDKFKGRAAKNIDDLVQRTDSPFTKTVISFPLPSKFRMPSLEIFDGSKDPLDHLESFKTVMCLQGVPDEIMCRAFPTTLKGPARIWFKKLTLGSVGSFAQLSRLFFNHFIGGQRYGRPTTHLLNVKQKEGETLRSYLTRFNKETLLVDGADDKVVLTTFISGLQSGDFLFSVYKDPPSTMTEMMYEAQRHMNGEEALLARDQTTRKKRKGDHADRPAEPHETRPKAQRNRNRRQEDRSGRGFNERFNHFTPLNAPVNHIFMQIRNDPALKWTGKLLTDSDKRPRDKYCRFHRDHRHNTEDCYDLKRQMEELIKQGKLQRFVEKGGTSRSSRKAYARQIHNVLVTQKSNKKPRVEDLPITFIEEDACKVFHPHDDALVVTMEIVGYSTRRVLIENGSSADIIYLTAFQQMKIGKDQLQPIETPLVGFAGTSVYPLGMVTLQIIAEQVHQTLIVEERQNIAEPTEELEEIVLKEGNEKKTTRIGTSMTKEIRALVVSFLRENADVFAWSHDDMLGIGTEVISHKLNVNPSTSPVKQKRRVFAPERNTAVMEEVDKLLKAGFIREVYYPEWLANVVMVKKSTGKWRMCVDFTDLNKACPKDSYPLPRIDQLVDSTAGHKLLSFMDAFSGYNQIQMTEGDQEKTAFITSRGLFCYKRGIEANPDKIKAILDMSPPKTVKEVQSLTRKAAALNSSVLIREEKRIQKPVYYTSRALRGAEERYSNMKKLAFALLIASRKLRPYFQSHPIIVSTDYPLRKAMNKADAAGRLVQWSIEMSEFHINYRPRIAIKALALADFIAEFTQPWKDERELEEGEAWTLRFRATNNEAEYEALLAGLKLSKSMGIKNLTVKSDSQLIVGQVKGEYEAKEDRMKKYLTVVNNLLTQFRKVELLQIPREETVKLGWHHQE